MVVRNTKIVQNVFKRFLKFSDLGNQRMFGRSAVKFPMISFKFAQDNFEKFLEE